MHGTCFKNYDGVILYMANIDGYAKLVYGIRNGKTVHVRDAENGIACGCTCPQCGDRLIARQGEVKVWHFAHESGAECATAPETALHKLAKELYQDARQIPLPPLYAYDYAFLRGAERADVLRTGTEHPFGDVTPDVWVQTKDRDGLFVEIRVTHAVDDAKFKKLQKLGFPVIEADLSKVSRDISREALSEKLFQDVGLLKWVYHPDQDAYRKWKEEEDAKAAAAAEAKRKALHAKRSAIAKEAAKKAAATRERNKQEAERCKKEAEEKLLAQMDAHAAAMAARNRAESMKREKAEKERQERLGREAAYQAEYASKDAVGKLLMRKWCQACNGSLRRCNMLPDETEDLYSCLFCGRTWEIDKEKGMFRLSETRICKKCGRTMVLRNGYKGKFYGCSGYPACRGTSSV